MSSRLHRRATTTAAAVTLVAAGIVAPAHAANPTVTTSPPDTSLITDTYALLSGVINPNGIPSAYHFEYGPTTTYGTNSPDTSAGNGKAEVPVDYSVDDLTPGTTYHYRLVGFPDASTGSAYAAIGQIPGADQSFTTSKALAVSFAKKTVKVSGKGKVKIPLAAVGPTDEVTKGKLKLTAKIKTGKKKAKTRTIASKAFSVKAGASKTITVTLSRAARKVIAEKGKLKATATAGKVTTKLTLKG